MPRFYLRKLVRDKIVPNCDGDSSVTHVAYDTLDDAQYRQELVRKAIEEANEVPLHNDNRHELLAEIADLQAVVDALWSSAGYTAEQVERAMAEKEASKGGFGSRHYVEYVDVTDDSVWAGVFRNQPGKYVEQSAADGEGGFSQAVTVEPGEYTHAKSGKSYHVIGTALHTETNENLVVYEPMYPSEYELFARPAAMFSENIVIDGIVTARFKKRKSES